MNLHALPDTYLKLQLSATCHDKLVSGTTAWLVLRLRREKRLPIWRVTVNILNKQARRVDKVLSSSLGVGLGAKQTSQ